MIIDDELCLDGASESKCDLSEVCILFCFMSVLRAPELRVWCGWPKLGGTLHRLESLQPFFVEPVSRKQTLFAVPDIRWKFKKNVYSFDDGFVAEGFQHWHDHTARRIAVDLKVPESYQGQSLPRVSQLWNATRHLAEVAQSVPCTKMSNADLFEGIDPRVSPVRAVQDIILGLYAGGKLSIAEIADVVKLSEEDKACCHWATHFEKKVALCGHFWDCSSQD
eukprot:1492724-Amphidinium_carterae.1